jgi:lactate dehydrogenase-like 2-hydroxyacid dehydrogenase
MSVTRAAVLQLCPFSTYLEAGLADRFDVVRWFELDASAQAVFLREWAAGVRAVVTGGHVGCPNTLMDALPSLGLIAINGVGVDKVDLPHARSRAVRVSTTPGALTEDVADLAVGLVISLLRGIAAADAYVRAGHWATQGDRPLARKVSGRRFGIVGLGHIGSAIGARLAAFGPVAYTGPQRKDVPYAFYGSPLELAGACDVLVLACPANAATHHLVDAALLDALGPAGYVVNVARGSVVDEAALMDALAAGRIAGAALDVFEDEPRVPAGLRDSARVVLTPHMASATQETRTRMADLVLANLDALRTGSAMPTAVL